MFALRESPPPNVDVGTGRYRLVRVFKHDFYAATCLYEASAPAAAPKVVVKFGRMQSFCGLPMGWIGRLMRRREEAIYQALAGVRGVPRWVGQLGENGYAIEYIEGRPLDHVESPPPGFFDALKELFDAIHARGVAYCDANKRSNILVGPGGRPFLVDYQLAIRRRDDLPWPISRLVARAVDYVMRTDLYHLYKHKRKLCPGELSEQEEALSRRRRGLHLLHRKLTKPYRALRRGFLRKQYQEGRLISPTAELEDHDQPEKATWREPLEGNE